MTSIGGSRESGRPPEEAGEGALAARLRQQAAVAELGELALGPTPLPELMQAMTERVAATLGAPFAKVLTVEPRAADLLLRAGVGWRQGRVGAARVETDRASQAGYTLRSSAPVVAADLRREARFRAPALLEEHGIRSGVSVVVGEVERPLGVLAVHDTDPDAFSEADAHFLQSAAHILALAIRRRETEEVLRSSESRYRTLAENASDLIEEISAEGRFTFTSPNHLEHLGWRPEELATIDPFSLVHEEDRPRVRALFDRTVAEGSGAEATFRVWRRDGALRWYEAHGRAVRGAEGPGMVLVLREVTARVEAEEELAENVARLRALQENASDLIGELGADGRPLAVNRAYSDQLGWDPEEFLAIEDPFELVHPEDRARVRAAFERALYRGGPVRAEYRLFRRDGTVLWVEANANAFRARDGRPRAVVIARDVTARKEAEAALRESEERLRRSQRLEAMGHLAGGIAHDFNNMLTVISGYCDLLRAQLAQGHPARPLVEEVAGAQERAAGLTRQLLAFGRVQVLRPQPLDLNGVVRGVEGMLQSLLGEGVAFDLRLDPELPSVRADPGAIEQALVNLVMNARDAMPEGGELRIATRGAELGREAAAAAELEAGPCVELAVTDSGVGLDEATRARIFEPFFTTKERGRGTGLGLATVYGILRQSGGGIAVESAPGEGTTFRLWLPAAERSAAAERRASRERAGSPEEPGARTVLVCEDDGSVRELLLRLLRGEGHRVRGAADAEEALARLRAEPGRIDLLLTDVVMPGLSGPELARRAAALRPDLRVLFVSGYAEAHAERHEGLPPEAAFLAKPFDAARLRQALRAALDAPPPSRGLR